MFVVRCLSGANAVAGAPGLRSMRESCAAILHSHAARLRAGLGGMRLKQLAKFFNGEASVTNDSAERKGVDGVVAGNRQNAPAICHDDVFPLAGDQKSGFLQSTQRKGPSA